MVKTTQAPGGGQRPDPWSGKTVYAAQPKKKDITHQSVLCINPGAHYLIPRSVCVWERVCKCFIL